MVLAYVEYLEQAGELDLEAATEFLVLIAALLELKSPADASVDDEEGLDLDPPRPPPSCSRACSSTTATGRPRST